MDNGVQRRARVLGLATVTGSLALLAAQIDLAAQQDERHSLSEDRVAIHNLAGAVTIRRGSGSDVVVTVARGGDDAGTLRVESGRSDGTETLTIVYPGDEFVYPRLGRGRSRFRVGRDGALGGENWDRDDARQVTVRGSGSGTEAYADLTISIPAGKRVAVYQGIGEVEVSGVQADLRVDLSSGRVTSEATRGRLDIDTGSGSVQVSDAEGDLRVDTGSGRVTGSGITAGVLRIDTGSGGIQLSDIRARDIRLDTGSGGVEIELLTDVDVLDIDTGSGGVTVKMPSALGAKIEVETGSGTIDFDFPITVTRVERSHLVGRIGDGNGRIRIDTGSGSVTLIRT